MVAASFLLFAIGVLHFANGLVELVVYPANKRDVSACSRINVALVEILGYSRVRTYKSRISLTTEFWLVEALEFQKARVSNIPGVCNNLVLFSS